MKRSIPSSSFSAFLRGAIVSSVFVGSMAMHGAAFAEGPAVTARPVYVVAVRGDGDVDATALRDAIANELGAIAVFESEAGASAARGTVTIALTTSSHELAVTYAEPGGASVSRVVTTPASREETVRLAAMLAGNLARHQVDDILGPLPAPTPAPTPTAPATPAPAEPAEPETLPVNVGLFYPLSVNAEKPDARVRFDWNVLYGKVGELDGLGLGTVNVATRRSRGLRMALLVNRSGGDVEGLDMATLGNLANGKVEGGQMAWGFNLAQGKVEGFQASWLFNGAGDVNGAQLGLVNVAGKVKGLQLGLVNVADDVEGLPLGLVSVTRTGGVHPVAWASSTSYANAGLKFATKYTYTMISGHMHYENDHPQGGPGFTVGAHVPFDPLYAEFDVQAVHLFGDGLSGADQWALRSRDKSLAKARVTLGLKLADHLSLFVGGSATATFRYPNTSNREVSVTLGPEVFGGLQF